MKSRPKLKIFFKLLVVFVAIYFLIFAYQHLKNTLYHKESQHSIVLLLPDGYSNKEPNIKLWQKMADKQGLTLKLLHDSDLIRPSFDNKNYVGIILADEIHSTISSPLVGNLKSYVNNGGNLMLVYNAATLSPQKVFFQKKAPLSELVGADYALYDQYARFTIQSSEVGNDKSALLKLGIQPGKFVSFSELTGSPFLDNFQLISNYGYGPLVYSWFQTKNQNQGIEVLLKTPKNDLIASKSQYGKGQVLFVNLPLTFISKKKDTLFISTFLRYFAFDMLMLPMLSNAPNGIGGQVLNIQISSIADLYSLWFIQKTNIFDQGPYSVSVAIKEKGSQSLKNGLIADNKMLNDWIKYFRAVGYSIGVYGPRLKESNNNGSNFFLRSQYLNHLQNSKRKLESMYGKNIVEYIHPNANQPRWLNKRLKSMGFKAIYKQNYLGDSPLQEPLATNDNMLWVFPPAILGNFLSFAEFSQHGISSDEVKKWLVENAYFVANNGVIRFILLQPDGARRYTSALQSWFEVTQQLQDRGKFKWYTMAGIVDYLESRKKVQWKTEYKSPYMMISSSSPSTLKQQAWIIHKKVCQKPLVTEGIGHVEEADNRWVVSAGDVKQLKFRCLQR